MTTAIGRLFAGIQKIFTPEGGVESPVGETDGRKLAFMIGTVALALAPVMIISTYYPGNCYYDSISHFYYSRVTGDIFVGALFFIGGVLLAYNSKSKWENRLARLAGICAFGVAIFPTTGSGCEGTSDIAGRAFSVIATDNSGHILEGKGLLAPDPFALFAYSEVVHLLSAAVLFIILIVFCFFIFTIVFEGQRVNGKLTPQKKRRNAVYFLSGAVMLGCLLTIAANKLPFTDFENWNRDNWMFKMEAAMLASFGISWIIKGRFHIFRYTVLGRFFDEEATAVKQRQLMAKKAG